MRKGEVRRQAIIDAADRLFCRNGYAETTVEDILAALGCSKGSFYHYFDSKLAVLQAICEDKASRSFAVYQQTRVTSTREKLNTLLYYAQPFRPEEEEWLELILRLRRRGEALMLDGALRQRQRALFKPELQNLLMILNETGAAHIARPRLDDVVFEAFTAFYDELCETIITCSQQGRSVAHDVTAVVEAARFMWERVLDMAYGSMELVKLDEIKIHPDTDFLVSALKSGDIKGFASKMYNVLENVSAGKFPIIEDIKKTMLKGGALGSMMSGSGPTVFGIFDDEQQAKKIMPELKKICGFVYLAHTL